jgi:predicted dehydrogenase/FAD/FMN-containing dehydrogenase
MASPSAAPSPLRIGLVGCSWFAIRSHIPALMKLETTGACRLNAVCSRTKKSMAKAEAKIMTACPDRSVKRHADIGSMLRDPQIDAVLIVLPIPMMPEAIEAALRAGKHVLSEKPVAPTVQDALRLMAVLRELGEDAPAWAVVENWRFKRSIVYMRQQLQQRAIGQVISAHCTHHHAEQLAPAAGGGRQAATTWRSTPPHTGFWLVDVGVHWARALRVLLGEPISCSASLSERPPGPGHATASSSSVHGWVRFESATATVSLSSGPALKHAPKLAAATTPAPSLRIDGDRGSLLWWPSDPTPDIGGGDQMGARSRITVERHRGDGNGCVVSSSSFDDDWVEGGVVEALESGLALLQARIDARGQRGSPSGGTPQQQPSLVMLHSMGCENAVRDLVLVWALLRSHEEGRSCSPSDLLRPEARGLVPSTCRYICDASRTWQFTPSQLFACATTAEVQHAVALAAAEGMRLRAIGSMHSWSRFADSTGGVCIQMHAMDRVLSIDAAACTITAEPGITLRELRAVLAECDLTLPSWPMLLEQTLGGATVGSGSHGSSSTDGTLSDAIVSLRLVTADGKVREVSDTQGGIGAETEVAGHEEGGEGPVRPSLMRAARVSFGRIGIAVAITLQCVPRYYVRRHLHVMDVGDFVQRADALFGSYRHLWAWWSLGEQQLALCCLEDVGRVPANGASRYDGENWYHGSPRLEAPASRDGGAGSSTSSAPGEPSREHMRLVSLQYAFPRARLEEVISTLARADGPWGGRVVELKFVGGPGGSLLGINSEGPAICVNLLWRVPASDLIEPSSALWGLEEVLLKLGGTPHLGKLHSEKAWKALAAGEQHKAFSALAIQLDPAGCFSCVER